MSRFGIRTRLKKAMGLGQGPQIVRHELTYVLPDGTERKVQAEEHYSLLMAADAVGITISTGRRAGGYLPRWQVRSVSSGSAGCLGALGAKRCRETGHHRPCCWHRARRACS